MAESEFVLITGAARRVGRAIALSLAQDGFDIAIHYGHSEKEARSVQKEIEQLGRKAIILQADLADSEAVSAVVPSVLEKGNLVALINSAAIFEQGDHTASLTEWQRHLAINVTAPFMLSQAFAAHCEEGKIVNILDWKTARSDANHLSYAVSKEALTALTRNLAVSLAPRFQVNGLALGAILPPSDGRAAAGIIEAVPAGRWADLDEVGQAIRFLLEGPSYITGEVLALDGGRHLV